MADLENLPNVAQSSAAFIAEFAELIVPKTNENGGYGVADVRARAVAQWGDFVDGAVVALQSQVRTLTEQLEEVGGGVTVVRDIDYTAEASSGALSDGNVTIAGIQHTVQNVAQLSACEVINGAGIRLRYKESGSGAATLSNSSNTAGGIYATLVNLIPNHRESHRYLFLWQFSVAGDWDTGAPDSVRFVLYAPAGGSGTPYEGVIAIANGGALYTSTQSSGNPHFAAVNSTSTGVTRYEMLASDLDVIGVRSDYGGDKCTIFAGAYDEGFPDVDDLVLVGNTQSIAAASGSQGFGQHNLAITRAMIVVPGPSGPTGTPHGVDIHRLRVLDLGP